MIPSRFPSVLLVCALCAVAGAQTFSSAYPGTFVDISTTGGTAIPSVTDDSEHTFTTTIGNGLFPAGSVLLGNNGAVVAGLTTGTIGFTNATIGATGEPSGIPSAGAALLPWWDDLDPFPDPNSAQCYWQELGGVLYIMWKDVSHYSAAASEPITFEIQVFGSPAPGTPWIQFLYPDATFGGSMAANDNGASATVGWIKGSNALGQNTQWSFNSPVIADGTVLSIFPPMILSFSSPFGPGSIQIDITNGPASGTYFLPITFNAGLFPSGWFYGIDITFGDLIAQAAGVPFVGSLGAGGSFTLGPIGGAPPITLYSVAIGFDTAVLDIPSANSAPEVYTIP